MCRKIALLFSILLMGLVSLGTSANAATIFIVASISLPPGPAVTADDVDGSKVYITDQVMEDIQQNELDFFCIDPVGTNYLGFQNPEMGLSAESTYGGVSEYTASRMQFDVNQTVGQTLQFKQATAFALNVLAGFTPTNVSDASVASEGAAIAALTGTATPDFWTPTNSPYAGFSQVGLSPGLPDHVITGAVPEPATWAMMLLGFGFTGFASRLRRRRLAVVVLSRA